MNLSLKDSRINNAVALFTSGELNKCLSTTLKLIKIYPMEPFLLNLAGVVNASMQNYEQAVKNYKKALSLNSKYIISSVSTSNQSMYQFNDGPVSFMMSIITL